MQKHPSYLLISNVWNEEGKLESIFKQISKQTIKPSYWLIINDGSTDNTLKELQKYQSRYSNIPLIAIYSMPRKTRGNLDTLGVSIRTALKSVPRKFDFYAKIDIDTVIPNNFFDKIFYEFNKDPMLMCASGAIYFNNIKEINRRKWARGSGLTIRGPFFDYYRDNIPGVTLETWIGTLAKINGYKTKEIRHIKEIQLSPSTQLTKKGAFRRGRLAYYFGFNPLSIILRTIITEFILRRDGKSLWKGYLIARRNKWKINNELIRQFWFKNSLILDIKALFSMIIE
jgi:glycosyltransferase involved in cell wall biosynthesis